MDNLEYRTVSTLTNNEVAIRYAHTKEPALKTEILVRFEGMVINCCRHHTHKSDYEDLMQEGRIALIQALETYDPTDFMFSTIAYVYISGKVRHYLRDKLSTIRTPSWVQEHYRKEALARAALEATFERKPTNEDVARAMKITVERLEHIHTASKQGYQHVEVSKYISNQDQDGRKTWTPDSLMSNIFGLSETEDDGMFLDQDERLWLESAPITDLMTSMRIGIFEARKLQTFARNMTRT